MAKNTYFEQGDLIKQENRGMLFLGFFMVLLPFLIGLFFLMAPEKANAETVNRTQAVVRHEVVLECEILTDVSAAEIERLLAGEYMDWTAQGTLVVSKSSWDILWARGIEAQPIIDSQREYWEKPEESSDRSDRESCVAGGVLLPDIDEDYVYDWASTYGCVPGSDPVVRDVCLDVKINHECIQDLRVVFTNDIHSVTIWDRWGSGCTDGGHDDDSPSDNDIEFWDYCFTTEFDGDPVEDDWYLEIYDEVAPYGCGNCYLAYYEVTVYYDPCVSECYVYPDELYFDVEIGSCESHSFYIENIGDCLLEGDPPYAGHPSFTVTPDEGYSLDPGEVKFYQVEFCPTECGDIFTSVFLDSPCSDKPSLNGDVLPDDPICVIEPLELVFDVPNCGGQQTKTFTIANEGCGTLNGITPIAGHAAFSISPSGGYSLGPGEEKEYSVTFHADQCGNIFTSIFLDTPCADDPHLVGHGPVEPGCSITPTNLTFYVTNPHSSETDTQPFTVENDGCCDLVVSEIQVRSEDPEAELDRWTFTPSSFTITPGESQIAQAKWDPVSYGDCHIVEFDLGAGCDPIIVDANACSPVLITLFDLEVQTGTVRIRWESELGQPSEFRLTGSIGIESWELPYVFHEDPRNFTAFDNSESLLDGGLVTYRLEGREVGEDWSLLRSESVNLDPTPRHAGLVGAFPNPFNPTTTVVFNLDVEQRARLRIVDLSGREVVMLGDNLFPAGRNEITWRGVDSSGAQVTSGVYFLHLTTHGRTESVKLVLLR